MKWPEDRLERISINSYGIGGTNIHVSLDNLEDDKIVDRLRSFWILLRPLVCPMMNRPLKQHQISSFCCCLQAARIH